MIRFEADSAEIVESCIFVPGRVHQGTVCVGSVFTGVDKTVDSPRIQLRVDGITAYGRLLQELPEGMTGELQLTGEGMETLTHLACPFTCLGIE